MERARARERENIDGKIFEDKFACQFLK
jgi:hypothetical protein